MQSRKSQVRPVGDPAYTVVGTGQSPVPKGNVLYVFVAALLLMGVLSMMMVRNVRSNGAFEEYKIGFAGRPTVKCSIAAFCCFKEMLLTHSSQLIHEASADVLLMNSILLFFFFVFFPYAE